MADFCKQCSTEILGEDLKDLANLDPDGPPLKEGYGYNVLCEGCGPTLVDKEGNCILYGCDKKHGRKNETN
jgi:hypothetical protein